jgi:signal transduction histidine kinase/GAF domain-containing protein
MDLKDAVDLYRDVLQRYSQGFSLEEVLGSVAEALGGECVVLFVRRDVSSFLEPRLAWNVEEAERERIKDRLLPIEWVNRQPSQRYHIVDKNRLSEVGLEEVCSKPSDTVVLFPIRSHAHLRAALLAAVPAESILPDQQSYKAAAISAVLERMVELFSFDDKVEREEEGKEPSSVELGILSSYLISKADYARAASLSLDLLIKLLNMDGGTVHRVRGAMGEQQAALVASRGWGGMPEIIDHLFENKLIELLQAMRQSEEGEFTLDAGRIAEYFPGVKPYFHANQVKSLLLTPIFHDDRLVGLLTLFGKAYAAMEPKDMELLVQLSHRLGALFAGGANMMREARSGAAGWDFPALVSDLTRICDEALDAEDFLSSALRVASVELGARMSFAYLGIEASRDTSFLWYADAVYGGESMFKSTPGLARMASNLQRMAVVKPENPAMNELPAAEQAIAEGLVLLLVPARERGSFLLAGIYLPSERKLTKAEVDSLHPLTSLLLKLAMGLKEKAQAEGYRRSLEILAEIEGDLTASEDPERVLRILARGGRELLACDRAAIMVIDEVEGTFEGAVETADGSETGDLNVLAPREMAMVLERGHALYAPGNGEDEGSVETAEGARRSFIAIPLIGRRGRLGALIFEKMDRADFFGEFHRRLAHFLAGQAVSVLESYKEGTKLESTADETRMLLRISRRLASSATLEEMCGGLYKELDGTIGIDFLLLSIYGKAGIRRMAWLKGARDEVEAYDELLETQGPLMVALSRAGKLIRNNLNTFLRGPGEDELAMKGIRSYMAVTLQGEEMKGVLLVGSTRGGAFSERETALIERTAGLINSSFSIPMRHDALQSRIRLLEEMCRSQEEKVKTKTDLINMASHEIRHPLTLIMGFSEVLRDYGDTLDARESHEVVDKLNKAADRLRRSVVNMMEVSRLESGKMAVNSEEVDLNHLLDSLVEELRARSVEHPFEVEVESGAEKVIADRDKLEIILFNLMDNAVKYSPPGAKVEVFVRRTSREVLLGVRDQGQGISEESINLIFQPFRQGEGEEYGPIKGMGLGLYIVNRLVEAHGGHVEVRSEHGRGSTFMARIPQPESGEEDRSWKPGALEA